MARATISPGFPNVDGRGVLAFALLAAVETALWLSVEAQTGVSSSASVHGLAIAHALLPGLAACFVLLLAKRSVSASLWLGALTAALFGGLFLAEDFENFASRTGVPFLGRALGALAAGSVPLAAWLASRAERRATRLVMGVAIVGLHVLAQALIPRAYLGLHLACLLASGAVLTALLPTLPLPSATWLFVAAGFALALIPPGSAALVAILRRPALAVTPFVARAHASLRREHEPVVLTERLARPPTKPGLPIESPLVVLLTIDAVRADVLAREGDKLPTLRALSGESVRFTMARTAAPSTVVALNAMFTGRQYTETRWARHPRIAHLFPHLDESPRFPALLSAAGVGAVALDTTEWMTPEYGISRGFARVVPLERSKGDSASAAQIVDALLTEVSSEPRAPAFLYAHFLEPHAPYDAAGQAGDDWSRYIGEVAIVDHEIGRLIEGLRSRAVWDRTVLIVTSDHGEAFGEHFSQFHGFNVYEELVRVPLLIRAPGVAPREVDTPVSLMDLGPTVLDLFGEPTPGSFEAETLVPVLLGTSLPARPIAMVSGRLIEALVLPDGFKVIYDKRSGSAELYDLSRDPGESRNLFEGMGDYLPQLEMLRRHFEARELTTDGYEAPFRPM